ncbi:uncharacterized protein LOC111916168 isoform X1 [Lactuca sativa]|uniref:uncharacterized protein LOC111916168 isoform X1 n=1 Tax=Lactuca sativa TaxID=4236 RepID=UPI000CD80C8E|nr:uncharacterized protein LOC111916168 isoform X1 [Lactuca sativa]
MRARLDLTFTDFLLTVGNGVECLTDDYMVNLPSSMLIETSHNMPGLNALIDFVYPTINVNAENFPFASNRVVLTTKNLFVDEINDILINKFLGIENKYISFDETADPNDQAQYEDLLHSLTPNGDQLQISLNHHNHHLLS